MPVHTASMSRMETGESNGKGPASWPGAAGGVASWAEADDRKPKIGIRNASAVLIMVPSFRNTHRFCPFELKRKCMAKFRPRKTDPTSTSGRPEAMSKICRDRKDTRSIRSLLLVLRIRLLILSNALRMLRAARVGIAHDHVRLSVGTYFGCRLLMAAFGHIGGNLVGAGGQLHQRPRAGAVHSDVVVVAAYGD